MHSDSNNMICRSIAVMVKITICSVRLVSVLVAGKNTTKKNTGQIKALKVPID